MKNSIRGIECSLSKGGIKDILIYLAKEPAEFYIPWCSRIDNKHTLLPRASKNKHISALGLEALAQHCIWELVLQIYPPEAGYDEIETYDDFINSACVLCLIYYDCGLLDMYVKSPAFLEKMRELLLQLNAEGIALITDANDGRTALHL